MIVQITFLLLTNVVTNSIQIVSGFDLKCPDRSQQQQRQRAICKTLNPEYMCLKDLIKFRDKEVCDKTKDFQRPGYKIVWRENLDGQVCDKTHYQPIRYYTSDGSNCIFQKSRCSDEGQISYREGSLVFDRRCRCDFQKGYAFVNKPKNTCFCIASEEDCSCYRKQCIHGFVLSPDYTCVRNNDDEYIYSCPNYIPSKPPESKEKEKYHYQRQELQPRNNLPLTGYILVLLLICILMLLIRGKCWRVFVHLYTLFGSVDFHEQNSTQKTGHNRISNPEIQTTVVKDVENLSLILDFLTKRVMLMIHQQDGGVEWKKDEFVQVILQLTKLIQSLLKDQQTIKDYNQILTVTQSLGDLLIKRTQRNRRRTVNIYPHLCNVPAEFQNSVSIRTPTKDEMQRVFNSQYIESQTKIKQILKDLDSLAENREEKQASDNSNNKEIRYQIRSHGNHQTGV